LADENVAEHNPLGVGVVDRILGRVVAHELFGGTLEPFGVVVLQSENDDSGLSGGWKLCRNLLWDLHGGFRSQIDCELNRPHYRNIPPLMSPGQCDAGHAVSICTHPVFS
jgi:hypothetical protein